MKTRNILVLVIAIAILGGLYFLLSPSVELSETSRQREFELTISNRRLDLDPPIIRLNQNDEVTFRITADEEAEFHVHSYDAQVEVRPEDVALLTFDATLAGRYNLELHLPPPPGEEEGQEVVIGAIEVSPGG